QNNIQMEIDSAVGADCAPTFNDIPKLKYMLAFLEECNCLTAIGPLGLSHEMTKDEVIDGYLYPKGAAVFMNIWDMGHNERYFDKLEGFIPDHFLENPHGIKNGVTDDPACHLNMLFRAGKHVCPG
ncbi:hypothetical protein GYMLUDRAFT_111908, partial [Collybiopsis luxurians FD-317 M1]